MPVIAVSSPRVLHPKSWCGKLQRLQRETNRETTWSVISRALWPCVMEMITIIDFLTHKMH